MAVFKHIYIIALAICCRCGRAVINFATKYAQESLMLLQQHFVLLASMLLTVGCVDKTVNCIAAIHTVSLSVCQYVQHFVFVFT